MVGHQLGERQKTNAQGPENFVVGCPRALADNPSAMFMVINANAVLWVYIVLLVAGGLMGFLKAGSKASLIASVSFAAVLSLCAAGIIFQRGVADFVLAFLLVFFGMRLAKSKKFMPNGMMVILTLLALVLRHI